MRLRTKHVGIVLGYLPRWDTNGMIIGIGRRTDCPQGESWWRIYIEVIFHSPPYRISVRPEAGVDSSAWTGRAPQRWAVEKRAQWLRWRPTVHVFRTA